MYTRAFQKTIFKKFIIQHTMGDMISNPQGGTETKFEHKNTTGYFRNIFGNAEIESYVATAQCVWIPA